MKKFFKTASFGKNSDVVKFKTNFKATESVASASAIPAVKPKNLETANAPKQDKNKVLGGRVEKKQKKKVKSQTNTETKTTKTKPSLKTKKQKNAGTQKDELSKIKSGRVEKKKRNKKPTQKQEIDTLKVKAIASQVDSLADKLKESLKGGRFRYINEQLYTMNSEEAQQLFAAEPESFDAYHEGYRHQVQKWPMNPLNRIIKIIKRLPKTYEIGDFGCGEGILAKSVHNKVYSMDLVAARDDIIACDMAQTPLPAQSLDVAVYCLSLMGTNLHDYLLEANRVLKKGGLMLIAEIQSRFDADVRPFLRALEAAGFELIRREDGSKIFFFFQLKKTRDVGKVAKLPLLELKPCIYKKR